jgi:uncharacterized membrane protein YqjE
MTEPLRAPEPEPKERPLGDLVRDLTEQTSRLVRQEVRLARTEMQTKAREAASAAVLFAVAAVAAFFVLWALSWAAIEGLSETLPGWASALIVAGAWALIAAIAALVGRNRSRRATPPVPEETIETLKDDVRWAKERTRSGER